MSHDYKKFMPFLDIYFSDISYAYRHQFEGFYNFVDVSIPHEMRESNATFFESETEEALYRYRFKFSNIRLKPPVHMNDEEYMFPSDARKKSLTYDSKLVADVVQIQERIDVMTDEKTIVEIGKENEVLVGRVPIPVKSKFCTTVLKSGEPNSECPNEPGGYFIVNGMEKVIMSVETLPYNKESVYTKKDSKSNDGLQYTVQIRSHSYKTSETQIASVMILKNGEMVVNMSQKLINIPVFIFIRALGIISDLDIIRTIVQNDSDEDMINTLSSSVNNSVMDTVPFSKINTQEEAIDYLITKLPYSRKYSTTDPESQLAQKKMHLKDILEMKFLPHMGTNLLHKAYYLCFMINKLLNCYLGRTSPDDRDDPCNKRIETSGVLLHQLFRQYYKKMLSECGKIFKRKFRDNNTPLNIINLINSRNIEVGLRGGLTKGVWGATKKVGVAQRLERYSFLQTISALRRVKTPMGDASTNKITSIRHVHSNQYGFICAVESPDGGDIGISKNMAVTASVTISRPGQIDICENIVKPYIIGLEPSSVVYFSIYCKVLINGTWIGLCQDPVSLYDLLKKYRTNHQIHPTVGIAFDRHKKELRIYTDGGRLYRPLMNVRDNQMVVTDDILTEINQSNESIGKKMSWGKLLNKYPEIIEYVDVEESKFIMVAMYPHEVESEYQKMKQNLDKPNQKGDMINRYDNNVYKRYSHCEIHPSTMLGIVTFNTPFIEHNQGPRNIYQFGMAKQAKGFYISNHNERMDISYLLYNPQTPLVNTRGMKYTGTKNLPSGENVIVAIQCYSGYNQEDSIVMNRSAVDRGLFRSCSLKKYEDTIQKQPSTSSDDFFAKPDPSRVVGMRKGNYSKLNQKGYVPLRTKLYKNDCMIGKISPVQNNFNGHVEKVLKDSSKLYKSNVPGVNDKIVTNVTNSEGYETMSMRVLSERVPTVGDKFASRMGQKGTVGILLKESDMPHSKDGLIPDIIINPNAIPSRMTIGQLIEGLFGKLGAIECREIDGTSFCSTDVTEQVSKQLEKHGYEPDGTETLYCGMTGRKMETKIYVTPNYYQRLKHMVRDKMHARARGPNTQLTRQPADGRARDGGLKFGEMEKDCMIAHGLSLFLNERFTDASDAYIIHVCDRCGLLASKLIDKPNYVCRACSNTTEISTIKTSYAFKLLIQELMAGGIATRFRVKNKE